MPYTAPSRLPILDEDLLREFAVFGAAAGDMLRETYLLFNMQMATKGAALTQAVAARDGAETARLTHALGGSAVNLGAPALADLLRETAAAAAEGDWQAAQTAADHFFYLALETQSALRRFITSLCD